MERWHLWAVLALVCFVIAGFCEAEARHGFSRGTYGAGFRGSPSQTISGDAALSAARRERQKAIAFALVGVGLCVVAVVSARRSNSENAPD
jgi:hypothetical protein